MVKKLVIGLTLFALMCGSAFAESRWAKVEYQFDTRSFNLFNVEGYSELPYGFETWGFIDVQSHDAQSQSRIDLDEFFMEIDLYRPLKWGIGPIAEYNDGHFDGDNVGRFGLFYEPDISLLKKYDVWLFTKWFPVATNDKKLQGSFAASWNPKNILDGRMAVDSFFDINFGTHNEVVSETMLRFRVLKDAWIFAEWKHNGFLTGDQDEGVGFGLQYRFS